MKIDNQLVKVPTEKLEEMVSLLKKIRSLETKKSSQYKKLQLCFNKEIRRRIK